MDLAGEPCSLRARLVWRGPGAGSGQIRVAGSGYRYGGDPPPGSSSAHCGLDPVLAEATPDLDIGTAPPVTQALGMPSTETLEALSAPSISIRQTAVSVKPPPGTSSPDAFAGAYIENDS